MNKAIRYAIILFLMLSPIIVALIYGAFQPPDSVFGIFGVIMIIFGIPFIGIVGLIVSALTRRSGNADTYSLYGYLAAAVLVNGYMVLV